MSEWTAPIQKINTMINQSTTTISKEDNKLLKSKDILEEELSPDSHIFSTVSEDLSYHPDNTHSPSDSKQDKTTPLPSVYFHTN